MSVSQSVTKTTSPLISQFPQLFMLYFQWLLNDNYLILISILSINNIWVRFDSKQPMLLMSLKSYNVYHISLKSKGLYDMDNLYTDFN